LIPGCHPATGGAIWDGAWAPGSTGVKDRSASRETGRPTPSGWGARLAALLGLPPPSPAPPAAAPRGLPPEALGPAFESLFASATQGLALLDREGRLLLANPALRRLAGPGAPLWRGSEVAALFEAGARPAFATLVEGARAGPGVPRSVPLRLAGKFAPAAALEVGCEAMRDAAGGAAALLLRVGGAGGPAGDEGEGPGGLPEVGRLAGGVAHDFNNLLTAILGDAEAVLARTSDPASVAELQQILDSAARGAALVRQLMAYARRQTLEPRAVALNELVRGGEGLLRRLLGEGVRLDLALEEPARLVKVDAGQFDQVLLNLAVNAREAMAGQGTLRVSTTHAALLQPRSEGGATIPPGRWVVLDVADSGQGIPPEVLPRIFEPFFTTRRDRGGTGLGLATVLGIVRQSGGHITVETVAGQGTTFRIWLPRHEGPAEPPPALPPPAADAAPPAAPALPVLLVEDESAIRRLSERALRRAGYEVQIAENGEEALALLESAAAAPCVLVSDVAMPGMDGLELARRARARFPGLPVVLVSGYAEAALGADLPAERIRFLAKPYRPQELVALVGAAVAAAPEAVTGASA
jgi:two-component system cell cycle sensor histidine kinase/response regulator CckA